MKTKKQSIIIALTAIAALTVAFSIVSGQKDTKQERSIEGVWRTMVTPRNCQTGVPLITAFPGLFTFNKGGTMSEFGIGPGSSPALRSPGHGIWQREQGWQDYSFAFTYYRYNASGVFVGSQIVRATLELGDSGDAFTTNSSIEVRDADDNVVATACATAVGTRFE